MDYSKANKEAWEQACAIHKQGYREDPALRLQRGDLSILEDDVRAVLAEIGLEGKDVAQFCCNNGRELLTLLNMGAARGTGFDISENFIAEGRRLANQAGLDGDFVATDIYDIDAAYAGCFDLLLVTIGALCWFEDLERFFARAALVLKDGGTLLINEQHPYTNMLAMANEDGYDAERPDQVVFSYFKDDPWVDSDGVDYVGGTTYKSKTMYSFSHSFGAIFNAMAQNGLTVKTLREFDYDISTSWPHIDRGGMPLSYVLVAEKTS
ncbi:MAG: methyltransferase domain-containing protein [Candidatus Latescibacteria bacterium]|nr:methyltransferase domain-containing protein [Candidatus Latescibacterota bacterium]